MLANELDYVLGVDTHRDEHVTAVVTAPAGAVVAGAAAPANARGYRELTDYRPVYLDNPQGDGTVVRTHVLAYEELPLTSENERLLSVAAQHPDAKVETDATPTR